MEIKQAAFSFGKVNQDIGKSKFSPETYYEAQHIRLTTIDGTSTGLVTNEKGNSLKLELPEVFINSGKNQIEYNNKIIKFNERVFNKLSHIIELKGKTLKNLRIIGHSTTKNGVVLFTTDIDEGIDIIFYVYNIDLNNTRSYDYKILYIGELNFSINYPIQTVYNYENKLIEKVYWTDGHNQLRVININHDEIEGNTKLIDLDESSFNFAGDINFTEPEIVSIEYGGSHTAGMIQYAYNLYNLNSIETKLSPLTPLIPLDKGEGSGGGEVNEVVGSTPVIKIKDIDSRYKYLKIYAIKYTSFNQQPSVNLIYDQSINTSTVTYKDDGYVIDTMTIEELLFIGNEPTVAKHIVSKDHRLIASNITEKSFDIPEELDCRCYSFSIDGEARIRTQAITTSLRVPDDFKLSKDMDIVTLDYNIYKYDKSGNLGGEGKFLKYNIVQKNAFELGDKQESFKFFKDDEIYRIGIVFYNKLGQQTTPKWMADFVAPSGNLEGRYNTLEVIPKQAFIDFLESYEWEDENDKPVGYTIVRADRTESDKTILYSGILSDFIIQASQDGRSSQGHNDAIQHDFAEYEDLNTKIPTWLVRNYEYFPGASSAGDKEGGILIKSIHGHGLVSEVYNEGDRGYKRQYSWIHNKMMQLYSPELLFNQSAVNLPSGLKVRVKGVVDLDRFNVFYWGQIRDTESKQVKESGKIQGTLNPHVETWQTNNLPNDGVLESKGGAPSSLASVKELHNLFDYHTGSYGRHAFIIPTRGSNSMLFDQYFRKFDTFIPANHTMSFDIYGNPEFAEMGQDVKSYNNDARYRYTNNLRGIMSDSHSKSSHKATILSVNSFNNRNLTLVLGGANQETSNRPSLRDLYNSTGLGTQQNSALVYAEIVRPETYLYTGNIYGGNSYEAKKRTKYVRIGGYSKINYGSNVTVESYVNNSPGDVFVNEFKFARIVKTDEEIYSDETQQITEIIAYPTETTIDIKNRNDISLGEWDARWQPRSEEYHKYNQIYSQSSNILIDSDVEHTFRRIKDFETRITASGVKYSNEVIDRWTKMLVNETLDLDGQYGPINGLELFQDNLYTFQDTGIAAIQVNPRIQIPTDDGLGLELGKGQVLSDYKYLTTTSGSINKYGIVSGLRGIYYYDALNKAVGRVPDNTSYMLSEAHGLKSFFQNRHIFKTLQTDNPLLKKGALFASDPSNNDIYMTLLMRTPDFIYSVGEVPEKDNFSFTWVYNEAVEGFVDLKTYKPSIYINKDNKLLLSKDGDNLYEQYSGNYNEFFGETESSYITLMLNPDVARDKIFTNIFYNSELYLNDVDQPDKTLTHIHAWNEYQDSGRIPLILGRTKNLRRKFRNWNADIPRDGRDRIRNPWIFLKLELDNESNYKMILHDIIVTYIL